MKIYSFAVLFGVFLAFSRGAEARRLCAPVPFKDYKYQASSGVEDRYYNSKTGLTLFVRCPPSTVTAESLIEKLKLESAARNTLTDAVYFEQNVHNRFKRVYVLTRSPTLQLTFSARRRNRAKLNKTQDLVEAAYKRRK